MGGYRPQNEKKIQRKKEREKREEIFEGPSSFLLPASQQLFPSFSAKWTIERLWRPDRAAAASAAAVSWSSAFVSSVSQPTNSSHHQSRYHQSIDSDTIRRETPVVDSPLVQLENIQCAEHTHRSRKLIILPISWPTWPKEILTPWIWVWAWVPSAYTIITLRWAAVACPVWPVWLCLHPPWTHSIRPLGSLQVWTDHVNMTCFFISSLFW